MIKDSGERTVYENGFQRDMHEGKGRFDLLPWGAIWELAKHCEEGAKKYGERNVDKGCPQHSLIDSAFRHLAKYNMGMTDEDHLRAALWNIAWAVQQNVYRPDMLDIPPMQDTRPNEVDTVDVEAYVKALFDEPAKNEIGVNDAISTLAKDHAEHYWQFRG